MTRTNILNQALDVIIVKKKTNYEARCKLFPVCKGVGKTKEEALKRLSSSISSFISNMIKDTLNGVFTSTNYTHILFDQTDQHEEHISFNLNPAQLSMPKSLLFKVSSFSEHDHDDDLDDESMPEMGTMNGSLLSKMDLDPRVNGDSETYVFGFPLNFN